MHRIRSLLTYFILSSFVLPHLVKGVNVTGVWDLSYGGFGSKVVWITKFIQNGENLYVTMTSHNGRELRGSGTIKGNEIEWSVSISSEASMSVSYNGNIEGTTMSGEARFGGLVRLEWQATRKTVPIPLGHNAGADCFSCHSNFKAAGTVFKDLSGTELEPGIPVSLIKADGSEIVIENTNDHGNIASVHVPDGAYIVLVGDIPSRSWHIFPAQRSCNVCHIHGGNGSEERMKKFHRYHTQIPSDNDCKHCHHFPASMSHDQLKTEGVLNISSTPPTPPGSQVEIEGEVYSFEPAEYDINTVRPDIFAAGYFSMFDVILAVAKKNGIKIDYQYDEDCKTHFIEKINDKPGDYWYHFSYDAGTGNSSEIRYRRAYRWDEALWRQGVWIKVVEGENLTEIKDEYREEIEREKRHGHVIPYVRISINPSDYKGNPAESHRITVSREYYNVKVTAHNLRSTGYPSLYPKPFQHGVVTSLDALLSLKDQGELDIVTGTFYTYFAQKYIHSYYVVALGFPDIGLAHASGRQGFVYVTNNGTYNRLPNGADRKFHMTSDISVVHAPDFSYWRWAELGNPFYESAEPEMRDQLLRSVKEDYEAIGRGFNLHRPRFNPSERIVNVSFNIFEPGDVTLALHNSADLKISVLFNKKIENIGIQKVKWKADKISPGTYYLVMDYENHTQIRRLLIKKK